MQGVEEMRERGGLIRLVPILLLTGFILLIDAFFAPALVDFVEVAFGVFSTPEIVVRAYFLLFFFQLILALSFFLFVRPIAGLRQRLILYFLLIEGLVLCPIWIFDDPEIFFRSEESTLTFFSSVVLVLCAVGAFLNLLILRVRDDAGKAAQVFWGLLSAAFLFAAMDEFFQIHERFARIVAASSFGQDLFTVAYAVGAFCVLAVFYRSFRKDLFCWKNYFFRLLATGVLVLGGAMFLDTVGGVFLYFFGRYFEVNHLCNSLEELMEFTAACLFCCAFFINILEADNGQVLKQLEGKWKTPRSHGVLKVDFAGIIVLALAGLLGIKFVYGVPNDTILEKNGCRVSVFADMDDGLNGADGLVFHPDFGLVVCNEKSGELLAFDHDGLGRVLVDSRSGLASPESLAFGESGIFVSDDSRGRVVEYQHPVVGVDPVELFSPTGGSPEGLAVDGQGRLYIADEGLSMVLRLTDGYYEILASSLDGLVTPEEIAIDDEGNLYVTDEAAQSVFRISSDGDVSLFADRSDGLIAPEGIIVHDGSVFITDAQTGFVFRFDQDGMGEVLMRFGKRFRKVSGIAFDDRGFLYLVANDPLSRNASIFKVELED